MIVTIMLRFLFAKTFVICCIWNNILIMLILKWHKTDSFLTVSNYRNHIIVNAKL